MRYVIKKFMKLSKVSELKHSIRDALIKITPEMCHHVMFKVRRRLQLCFQSTPWVPIGGRPGLLCAPQLICTPHPHTRLQCASAAGVRCHCQGRVRRRSRQPGWAVSASCRPPEQPRRSSTMSRRCGCPGAIGRHTQPGGQA